MKFAFLGNANNYPFMLARALKHIGHDVTFILMQPHALDRPENRYPEITVPYPPWIHDLSPFNYWDAAFPTGRCRRALRLIGESDVVVANLEAPALIPSLRARSVAFLSGSDLEVYCAPGFARRKSLEVRRRPRFMSRIACRLIVGRFSSLQKRGIQRADIVGYTARGLVPEGDAILDSLGVPDSRRLFVLMTEVGELKPSPPPENRTLRVLCLARFNWKRPLEPGMSERDYKGSDVMLRGIAAFLKESGCPLELRFARKGVHVAEAVRLIEELGFSDRVTWIDEMSQQAALEEIRRADIVMDQFGESIVGMVGLDAMALERPLIANWRPEIMDRELGEAAPVCQARTPSEVCDGLKRVASSRQERARLGREGRAFVEKHFSPAAAARKLLTMLEATNGAT